MAHGICEFPWLRLLLFKLGYPPSGPMNLYCNNKAARIISNNLVQYNHTKHGVGSSFY
jgi:hypothetical protein